MMHLVLLQIDVPGQKGVHAILFFSSKKGNGEGVCEVETGKREAVDLREGTGVRGTERCRRKGCCGIQGMCKEFFQCQPNTDDLYKDNQYLCVIHNKTPQV